MWLGAFRFGHQVGFDKGEKSGFAAGITAKLYPKVYRITDIVTPIPLSDGVGTADFQGLIGEIEGQIQPETWDANGGPAQIVPYPQNLSLVVVQTDRGHQDLQEFLEAKRTQ